MIRTMLSAVVAITGLFAGVAPSHADVNRLISGDGPGCDLYTGHTFDGDASFLERGMKFYALEQDWKAKYHSGHCFRYCKVFLYEKPQLKIFFDSFDRAPNIDQRLSKAKSAQIFCANDGDMHRTEVKARQDAEIERKHAADARRLQSVPLSGEVKTIKKLP